MGKRKKLICLCLSCNNTLEYIFKLILNTHITTAVMLNHFSVPRTMFFEQMQIWVLVLDDFAGPKLLR